MLNKTLIACAGLLLAGCHNPIQNAYEIGWLEGKCDAYKQASNWVATHPATGMEAATQEAVYGARDNLCKQAAVARHG